MQQEGNKVVNPILQHRDELIQEERFTVFSMCEIATWFNETQININELIAVHNDQAKRLLYGKRNIRRTNCLRHTDSDIIKLGIGKSTQSG